MAKIWGLSLPFSLSLKLFAGVTFKCDREEREISLCMFTLSTPLKCQFKPLPKRMMSLSTKLSGPKPKEGSPFGPDQKELLRGRASESDSNGPNERPQKNGRDKYMPQMAVSLVWRR